MILKIRQLISQTDTLELMLRGLAAGDAPPIPVLPKAPSRLSGANTFVVDYSLFLDSLSSFVSLVNINMANISSYKINKWNMGLIVPTQQTPTFQPYLTNPSTIQKPSIQYVSALDNEYKYIENHSKKLVEVVDWFKHLAEERGQVNVSNINTEIVGLVKPAQRGMSETEFNSKSVDFSQSLRTHTNTLDSAIKTMKKEYTGVRRLGSIRTATTSIVDCGSINNRTLKN